MGLLLLTVTETGAIVIFRVKKNDKKREKKKKRVKKGSEKGRRRVKI